MVSLLKLRYDFDEKAEQWAVKRTKTKANYLSAPLKVFPNNPEHTVENTYADDLEEDKSEDASCSKFIIWSLNSNKLCWFLKKGINILDGVTPCCQQNGSTAQNVDSMGIPKSTNGVNQNYRNNIWCSETSEPNQQICWSARWVNHPDCCFWPRITFLVIQRATKWVVLTIWG